jgi:acyl carrier protein
MDLKQELKELIIESLKLEDVTVDQIEDGAPLFGEGLGLDSIDVLELTVAVEKRFQISIPDEEVGRRALASVDALAAFIREQRSDGD